MYLKARKGEDVKIEARPVEAKKFEVTGIQFPEVKFRLVCSKGFYVRSLVRDFGEALGVGACLTALERTRIGDFNLSCAQTVEEFKQSLEQIDS
jgi:tRNA pseudouridine55 synthase